MRTSIAAFVVLVALIGAAHAFGLGLGDRFGRLGAAGIAGIPSNINGKILLVDGVSFILQTDGASKICRAAGC